MSGSRSGEGPLFGSVPLRPPKEELYMMFYEDLLTLFFHKYGAHFWSKMKNAFCHISASSGPILPIQKSGLKNTGTGHRPTLVTLGPALVGPLWGSFRLSASPENSLLRNREDTGLEGCP